MDNLSKKILGSILDHLINKSEHSELDDILSEMQGDEGPDVEGEMVLVSDDEDEEGADAKLKKRGC